MEHAISLDFKNVADAVRLPVDRVQATVALLDEGNTLPFITRFRKDQTGGLNESQIRSVKNEVALQRGLIDRKQTIIKSIDSQSKLTDALLDEIKSATNHKRLEDIYLPFRPKRQTLAATARQQGLEPLAAELLEKHESEDDLASRALNYVRVDKGVDSVEQVYEGVGHLIAEHFAERADLRQKLRDLVWKSGKLVSRKIVTENENASDKETTPEPKSEQPNESEPKEAKADEAKPDEANVEVKSTKAIPDAKSDAKTDEAASEPLTLQVDSPEIEQPKATEEAASASESSQATDTSSDSTTPVSEDTAVASTDTSPPETPAAKPKKKKKKKKKKAVNKAEDVFKDFFEFREPLGSLPPHRILAINRGERAKVLRVRVECDEGTAQALAREMLVDPNHPQLEFMHRCVDDALQRLIIPSLEREIRRELTETAEKHAIKVFARNLRNLLLQPPLRKHRVLAVDPGYQSGCRYAVLDEFSTPLATGVVHVVGNAERRQKEESSLVAAAKEHNVTAIGIGNGAACRETEKMIARLLQSDLKDASVAYAIVNEAGASTYSTSVIGREELPDQDSVFRSAISIGRRMLDPLSELVKISPENLGIGMYQHDVKAKHLQDQLNEVVESCVNFVGVDVNTASPALLKYVAGLNQLTARRLYEHRQEKGPFRNREQFKEVPGFGDVTFVQAAGFLRILDGDQPLDATPIHPESYEIARQILERAEIDPAELVVTSKALTAEQSTLFTGEQRESDKPKPDAASESKEQPAVTSTTENLNSEKPAEKTTDTTTDVETSPETEAKSDETKPVEPQQTEPTPVEEAKTPATPSGQRDRNKVEQMSRWREKIRAIDADKLATDLGTGQLTLRDILGTITRPTRDPRESLPKPIFRREIVKIEDLEQGMQLRGRVVNVVDFGVFVDIGLGESSLVHVSQLSRRFVNDPHEVTAIGDLMKLWVTQVDKSRRRITLTAINPTPKPPRRKPSESKNRKPKPQAKKNSRFDKKRGSRSADSRSRKPTKPPKPKPAKPITDAMKKGDEPMRSFSDLTQFFGDDKKKGGKK